jgi:sulfite exporter TauE/SafE/copper chaperone CopZ
MEQIRLKIGGMVCANCQNKIEKKLRSLSGVKNAVIGYSAGTADITYDKSVISYENISAAIEALGYRIISENSGIGRAAGLVTIIAALYAVLEWFGVLNLLVPSRLADGNSGYWTLFVIGLATSVHCVAMCGGINISQCIPQEGHIGKNAFLPAFLYNFGRVASYTFVGFILGLCGFFIGGGNAENSVLPVVFQGILKLIAGAFMVIMGINMLGIFPRLRKFSLRIPKIFPREIEAQRTKSPFIIGLFNGLMPCGPLQSMQIVALASGNPLAGALSMFFFSVGTIPLMLGLGSAVTALGKKFTRKVMAAGAVLVTVLGLAMVAQGGSLSGLFNISTANYGYEENEKNEEIQFDGEKQIINSTLLSGSYPTITVKAGIPVKWVIDAPKGSINGCNNKMNIGEYGISNYQFKTGENVIEFTPEKAGRFRYNCWMGMIRGTINVVN